MGFGDDIFGMNWLFLVLIVGSIYELYVILWKGREDRKLIRFLKEEAYGHDDPDKVLNIIVMEYVTKKRLKQAKEIGERMDKLNNKNE